MQARIYVLGFVQGVGFRQFVKGNASKLGLTGTVKNLSDGRLEIVAVGAKEKINQLLKLCEKGPFFSEVKTVQVEWEDEQKFSDFTIIR